MNTTTAVKMSQLAEVNGRGSEQPLCPRCGGGRLHPYLVEFDLGPFGMNGARSLSGWTAICVGNEAYRLAWQEISPDSSDDITAYPPCGFSMSLTPH